MILLLPFIVCRCEFMWVYRWVCVWVCVYNYRCVCVCVWTDLPIGVSNGASSESCHNVTYDVLIDKREHIYDTPRLSALPSLLPPTHTRIINNIRHAHNDRVIDDHYSTEAYHCVHRLIFADLKEKRYHFKKCNLSNRAIRSDLYIQYD